MTELNSSVSTLASDDVIITPQANFIIDSLDDVPDLYEMEESPISLNNDYWTPETVGEKKRGFIVGIEKSTYIDEKTGEIIPLDCVVFMEQNKDKTFTNWRNGACRFVGTVQNAIESGAIIPKKTPVQLEYLGKKKTKKGNFTDIINIKMIGFKR